MMTFKCPRGGQDKDKSKKKKKKGRTAGADMGGGDSEPDEPLEPKPTLKVQRKGDVFTIQVRLSLSVFITVKLINKRFCLRFY